MIWLSDEEISDLAFVEGAIYWHKRLHDHLRYLDNLIPGPLSPEDFESEEFKKFSREWDEAANAEKTL